MMAYPTSRLARHSVGGPPTVLKSRKPDLHEHIAGVLASRFPEIAETEPELLAHHHAEVNFGRPSGHLAASSRRTSGGTNIAYVEALGHIERGIKLVAALATSEKRRVRARFSSDRRTLPDGARPLAVC